MRIEDAEQIIHAKSHDAGVAQPDAALCFAGVLVLADGVEPAAAVGEQAAVARRIGSLEAQHGDTGAVVEAGTQVVERLRRQQRRVGVEHQYVAGMGRQHLACREHRVGRAALLLLYDDFGVRRDGKGLGPHCFHAGSDDDGQLIGADRLRKREHVAEHRAAADLVQHLRQRGLHARALTGGQNDNEQGAAAHQALAFIG